MTKNVRVEIFTEKEILAMSDEEFRALLKGHDVRIVFNENMIHKLNDYIPLNGNTLTKDDIWGERTK